MRWSKAAFVVGCLSALWIGCGDEESEPAPPAPAAPAIQSLASAVCDLSFRCCSRGEMNYFFGPFYDETNCSSRLMTTAAFEPGAQLDLAPLAGLDLKLPNLGALEQANLEGRGTVNADALAKCVAYLKELPCPSWKEPEKDDGKCKAAQPPPEPTPCDPDKLFIGQVQAGGACTSKGAALECAAGLTCVTDEDLGVTGRCVKLGETGDPCAASGECGKGLYCTLADGTCQPYRKQGEACAYSDREDPMPDESTLIIRCEPGLSCDPITEICVARCERGSSCDSDDDCDDEQQLECVAGRCDLRRAEGLPCEQDSDCEEQLRCESDPATPGTRRCVPRLEDDQACASHGDCISGFCHPQLHTCAARVGAGALCATGDDKQCADGRCEREEVPCTADNECPITAVCDLNYGLCSHYCVELKPDGAPCEESRECVSEQCVVGYCRTPPLVAGHECDDHAQCESGFCGLEEERVCTDLPLPLGARCSSGSQCESLVCFDSAENGEPTCVTGLSEGEACGDPDQAPCNPHKLYCETVDEAKPTCLKLHETGEECDRSAQCRGECSIVFARRMCTPAAPQKAAVCDGNPSVPDAGAP